MIYTFTSDGQYDYALGMPILNRLRLPVRGSWSSVSAGILIVEHLWPPPGIRYVGIGRRRGPKPKELPPMSLGWAGPA
jgi:hypothetical protein